MSPKKSSTRRIHKKNIRTPASRKLPMLLGLFVVVLILAIFSYLTNPFVKFSVVADPNRVHLENGHFVLEKGDTLNTRTGVFFTTLGHIKSGWHILVSKFAPAKKYPAEGVDEIIKGIHEERFNPKNIFIISGEHFSVLYPRSLGIFYHSLLDVRTALDKTDWEHRQLLYLKTTAYALQSFASVDRLTTTIVPIGPRSVALVNFFSPPSDTLYSILYALAVMNGSEHLEERYHFQSSASFSLETREAATALIGEYRETLQKQYATFMADMSDADSGLVRKNISLSGTKDSVHREGAFYDSVMLWKTSQLAQKLGVVAPDQKYLDTLRNKIIVAYWSDSMGCFYDDLSAQSKEKNYYSSDWLVAYLTGMLTPNNSADRELLSKCVSYIQKNALDQPFGLEYQSDARSHQLNPLLKLFLPDYAATSIWSNWGMEYTKLLIALAQVTHDEVYLFDADHQLSSYAYNIKRYHGYPELYNNSGDIYSRPLYRAITRAGWVVTFEEAREMYNWTRANWSSLLGAKS